MDRKSNRGSPRRMRWCDRGGSDRTGRAGVGDRVRCPRARAWCQPRRPCTDAPFGSPPCATSRSERKRRSSVAGGRAATESDDAGRRRCSAKGGRAKYRSSLPMTRSRIRSTALDSSETRMRRGPLGQPPCPTLVIHLRILCGGVGGFPATRAVTNPIVGEVAQRRDF